MHVVKFLQLIVFIKKVNQQRNLIKGNEAEGMYANLNIISISGKPQSV